LGMVSETKQAWRREAEAELERLCPGVRATSIPERIWTNLYVRGLSPSEAARAADVHAWNKLTPFDRLRQAQEGSPRQRLADAILGEKKPAAASVKRAIPKPARHDRGKRG
jgi:hypothetical protein